MYDAFYGLREKPFSLLPDPTFIYMTEKHRKALTMLQYGIANQAGFTVITGEVGSGKTTLLRKLVQENDQTHTIGLVNNTQCKDGSELLRWILYAFGLDFEGHYHVNLYEEFTNFLLAEYSSGRRVVVVLDEAQQLGVELLEHVRMLSNFNVDKHQVVRFILVGQPSLRGHLKRPELVQFAQRIAVDFHLEGLDETECREYIRHRFVTAGGAADTFTDGACQVIWRASRGIPRLINVLCDIALVYGFSEQKRQLDVNLVREVVRDKRQGVVPLATEEAHQEKAKRGNSEGGTIERLFDR